MGNMRYYYHVYNKPFLHNLIIILAGPALFFSLVSGPASGGNWTALFHFPTSLAVLETGKFTLLGPVCFVYSKHHSGGLKFIYPALKAGLISAHIIYYNPDIHFLSRFNPVLLLSKTRHCVTKPIQLHSLVS